MVSSIEIPNAILKTRMVEGFIGIPKYPISAEVKIRGKRFGRRETKTIFKDLKRKDIRSATTIIAINKLIKRLFTKYVVPFAYITPVPVI